MQGRTLTFTQRLYVPAWNVLGSLSFPTSLQEKHYESMRKLKPREAKRLAQYPSASNWQSREWKPAP